MVFSRSNRIKLARLTNRKEGMPPQGMASLAAPDQDRAKRADADFRRQRKFADMNSWVKTAIILTVTYFVLKTMRDGWGDAGGNLPKSVSSLVTKATTLDRKLVILLTGSDWCPPCQAMERGMLGSPEWQTFAAKEIVFQKYDFPNGGEAQSPAHEDLLKLPAMKGFPTLVVTNSKGTILGSRSGFGGGIEEYIEWISSL